MELFFPPRPSNRIAPSLIQFYERRGWWAQLKMNGTCSVAHVDRVGAVTFKTRHSEDHRAWTPTEELRTWFSKFKDSKIVFELLHSKGGDVRDTAYIFDVTRWMGRDLTGTTFREREAIIQGIRSMTPRVIIATTHREHLRGLFESLSSTLEEGIVLKNPNGVLQACDRDGRNETWQVKCRVATKNYES